MYRTGGLWAWHLDGHLAPKDASQLDQPSSAEERGGGARTKKESQPEPQKRNAAQAAEMDPSDCLYCCTLAALDLS